MEETRAPSTVKEGGSSVRRKGSSNEVGGERNRRKEHRSHNDKTGRRGSGGDKAAGLLRHCSSG